MPKCVNCGNVAPDDAIFCDQCGTRFARPAPTAVAPAQPVTQVAPLVPPAAPAAPVAPASHAAPAGPVAPAAPAISAAAVEPAGRCSNCGAPNTPGEAFCSECGTPLAAPKPEAAAAQTLGAAPLANSAPGQGETCAFCGATLGPQDEYCFACGAQRTPAARPRASVPVMAPARSAAAAPAAAEPAVLAIPEPAPAAAVSPAPEAPTSLECPACGATHGPDDVFCQFCGAALVGAGAATAAGPLAAPAGAAPLAAQAPVAAPPSQVSGGASTARLVMVSSGVEIPLPAADQMVVGREDPYSGVYPDVDLSPHGAEEGGVSRRHLRIVRSGSQYTVEDLNSTNMTYLNRRAVQPGVAVELHDGDEIRAGRVQMIFRVS